MIHSEITLNIRAQTYLESFLNIPKNSSVKRRRVIGDTNTTVFCLVFRVMELNHSAKTVSHQLEYQTDHPLLK